MTPLEWYLLWILIFYYYNFIYLYSDAFQLHSLVQLCTYNIVFYSDISEALSPWMSCCPL
jgi:hypothetical protein